MSLLPVECDLTILVFSHLQAPVMSQFDAWQSYLVLSFAGGSQAVLLLFVLNLMSARQLLSLSV